MNKGTVTTIIVNLFSYYTIAISTGVHNAPSSVQYITNIIISKHENEYIYDVIIIIFT